MNVFSDIVGNKPELIRLLDQAREAVLNSEIQLMGQPMFYSAPAAYDLGLVKDKDACFFGFSFMKGNGKSVKNEFTKQDPKIKIVESKPETKLDVKLSPMDLITVDRKITDREAERYKIGLDYVCGDIYNSEKRYDCGYKTDTLRGFKVHFNRCDIRKQEKIDRAMLKKERCK